MYANTVEEAHAKLPPGSTILPKDPQNPPNSDRGVDRALTGVCASLLRVFGGGPTLGLAIARLDGRGDVGVEHVGDRESPVANRARQDLRSTRLIV